MAQPKRKITQAEVVATHLGWEIGEVRDIEYQPKAGRPSVYATSNHYYCAPPAGRKPPAGWHWEQVATTLGREVFRAGTEAA